MPAETIGDVEHVQTANHPPRKDSKEYVATRKWLMGHTSGGCYVCGGPVDLSHPEDPANSKGMQDHHGGGIFLVPESGDPILVGTNLFGLEWSLGWGADPARVAAFVSQINEVTRRLGGQPYTAEIATTADVMAWVDSQGNANVKLCAVHHIAHEDSHTPDANGHEGVGIHNGPFPIWLGQATCDWDRFDMWGGSTGTVAVGHPGDSSGTVHVLHVSPLHPDSALYAQHRAARAAGEAHVLAAHHPHARLAHSGAHRDSG
jgi:hypothetical protein